MTGPSKFRQIFLQHLPLHAMALVACLILITLKGLLPALLLTTTAYAVVLNMYAFWRIAGYKDSPKSDQWQNFDTTLYGLFTVVFTCLAYLLGVPYLYKITDSLALCVAAIAAFNFYVAWYAFEWGTPFKA